MQYDDDTVDNRISVTSMWTQKQNVYKYVCTYTPNMMYMLKGGPLLFSRFQREYSHVYHKLERIELTWIIRI